MKKTYVSIFLLAVLVSFLLQLVFGPYLSARLATWPQLQRLGIIRPQAPIVVTNKETVRVSDSQDSVDVAGKIKSRIASIATFKDGTATVTGGAVSLAADGIFITVAGAFPTKGASYIIILNDGRTAPITSIVQDPASSLVIISTSLGSVSVASFANSRDVSTGQKLALITNAAASFNVRFRQSYATAVQSDTSAITNADRPSRTFGVQSIGAMIPGEAIVSMDGDIEALWDGTAIVSSDIIRTASSLYFSGNKQIIRPQWGFFARTITAGESNLTSAPQGVLITKPDATTPAIVVGSPAQAAGLVEGDIIREVNGSRITDSMTMEEQLERSKPGDVVTLTVIRDKNNVSLRLTVGQLQ